MRFETERLLTFAERLIFCTDDLNAVHDEGVREVGVQPVNSKSIFTLL